MKDSCKRCNRDLKSISSKMTGICGMCDREKRAAKQN